MWKGIYKKWNPVAYLADKALYVEAVHDDWEGFRIWFGSEQRNAGIVTIAKFEKALLYVNSDESYRLSGIRNTDDVKNPHIFWQVEESDLIKEFHRQSLEIYTDWTIKHYAFLTLGDCLDVLSTTEPEFDNLISENQIGLFNEFK